jgi:hypothetical protein
MNCGVQKRQRKEGGHAEAVNCRKEMRNEWNEWEARTVLWDLSYRFLLMLSGLIRV